MTNRLYT